MQRNLETNLGFKILMVLAKPLLWLIRPTIIPQNPSQELGLNKDSSIIFFLPTKSLLDRMVLHRLCNQFELPTPNIDSPGKLKAGKAGLIYLAKLGFFQPLRNKDAPTPLLHIVEKGRQSVEYNPRLIPVSIIWGRNPDRKGSSSWYKLLFQDDEHAGVLQKLFIAIVQGRDALVNIGRPIDLQEQLQSQESLEQIARKLRRVLRVHFRQQRNVTLGPTVYNLSELSSEISRARAIRQIIEREAGNDSAQIERMERKAVGYIKEIAADQRHSTVRFVSRMLSHVFHRIFHGIECHHLDRVRQLGESHEIVFTASHRSHFDYLLLGHVLFEAGMVSPHTAAGVNLNFWPVGKWLRRCGGFFIRRKFGGNKLYTAVFNEYVHALVRRGHSISFYPEGGRSRNGRLLPAKTGMLAMVLHGYLRSREKPIAIVPVYIGYDTVAEIKSYQKELLGGKKKPESFGQLLNARKVIRRRYGKSYVNFGEPILVDQYLDQHIPEWRDERFKGEDKPTWFSHFVDDLAGNIMIEIGKSAVISPVSLISTALLATPRRALTESDLINFIRVSVKLFEDLKFVEHDCIPHQPAKDIISFAEEVTRLQRFKYPGSDVLHVNEANGVLMSYYRNNITHVFAVPAMVANYFIYQNEVARNDVVKGCSVLYSFLGKELFMPWSRDEFPSVIERTIESMLAAELLTADGNKIQRASMNSPFYGVLKLIAGTLQSMVERYGITLMLMARQSRGISREDLEKQCQLLGQRISILGGINDPEYHDRGLYRRCVDALRKLDLIKTSNEQPDIVFPASELNVMAQQVSLILSPDVRSSLMSDVATIGDVDE